MHNNILIKAKRIEDMQPKNANRLCLHEHKYIAEITLLAMNQHFNVTIIEGVIMLITDSFDIYNSYSAQI